MENRGKDTFLIGCMWDVPDPRAPYSQRHIYFYIIIIVVTVILAGMDTWNEITDWAVSKKEWLGSIFELPGGIPLHDSPQQGVPDNRSTELPRCLFMLDMY